MKWLKDLWEYVLYGCLIVLYCSVYALFGIIILGLILIPFGWLALGWYAVKELF